jgi:hypothetical protein
MNRRLRYRLCRWNWQCVHGLFYRLRSRARQQRRGILLLQVVGRGEGVGRGVRSQVAAEETRGEREGREGQRARGQQRQQAPQQGAPDVNRRRAELRGLGIVMCNGTVQEAAEESGKHWRREFKGGRPWK